MPELFSLLPPVACQPSCALVLRPPTGSVPPVDLSFISGSVAANLLLSALAFTWSSVSLTVLTFTSASLKASVLTYTLTNTSEFNQVSLVFSLLPYKQAFRPLPSLSHHIMSLKISEPAFRLEIEPASPIVPWNAHDQVCRKVFRLLSLIACVSTSA